MASSVSSPILDGVGRGGTRDQSKRVVSEHGGQSVRHAVLPQQAHTNGPAEARGCAKGRGGRTRSWWRSAWVAACLRGDGAPPVRLGRGIPTVFRTALRGDRGRHPELYQHPADDSGQRGEAVAAAAFGVPRGAKMRAAQQSVSGL